MAPSGIELTEKVDALFKVPAEARDASWYSQILATLPLASLATVPGQIKVGPDGLSYFILFVPSGSFESFTIAAVSPFCLEEGAGFALFARDPLQDGQISLPPELLISYGSVWEYLKNGSLPSQFAERPSEPEENECLLAAPSEEFFPKEPRTAIGSYLRSLGIAQPQVVLIMRGALPPGLAFNLFPGLFPSREEYEAAARKLLWFIPSSLRLEFFNDAQGQDLNWFDL